MKNIPEELIPVIEYWEQHGKKTIAVALVALVAGVGYWAWDRARTQTRLEVADALVQNYAGMPGTTSKQAAFSAIDELQSALGKAKDPAVVPMLRLRLAKMQYAAGNYADAEALYTELKGAAPEGFEDVPAVGLAATLEAAGKFVEAGAAYDAFVKDCGASELKLDAQIGSARCLAQAGKKDEAVKALEALLAEQEGLEAAKTAKEEAVEKAVAAFEPMKKQGLTSKDKEYADAEAALAALRTEVAAIEIALKDKNATVSRLKAAVDLVKRWEKREAVTLANVAAAQAEEAAAQVEAKPEEAAPEAPKAEEPKAEEPKAEAAPAAPAEKKAE